MDFPPFDYKVRIYNGQRQIFDVLRHKYVNITPEEWVRQHVVHYMLDVLAIPASLVAVERAISINGLTRRFDIICFDRKGEVYMLVECKNEKIVLDQKVFDQAFCYNCTLKARYVVITNGNRTLSGCPGDGKFSVTEGFPDCQDL